MCSLPSPWGGAAAPPATHSPPSRCRCRKVRKHLRHRRRFRVTFFPIDAAHAVCARRCVRRACPPECRWLYEAASDQGHQVTRCSTEMARHHLPYLVPLHGIQLGRHDVCAEGHVRGVIQPSTSCPSAWYRRPCAAASPPEPATAPPICWVCTPGNPADRPAAGRWRYLQSRTAN